MSDLLQLALDAQGGFAVWRSIRQIDVQLSISGGLWKVKGRPDGLPNISMQIDTQQPKLAIWPFKGAGNIGHFTPDRVWIEHDGVMLEQRSSPRDSFAGHVRTTPWDNLQELYFTGYAFWNYFNSPFILRQGGIESREIERHVENGETWRRFRSNSRLVFRRIVRNRYSTSATEGCCSAWTTSQKSLEGLRHTIVLITRLLAG